MPENDSNKILGSVIQITLVPRNLSSILTVVTVPWEECGSKSSPLKKLTSQLFGVTQPDLLDDNEYKKAVNLIQEPEFWSEIEHEAIDLYGFPPFGYNRFYHVLRLWLVRKIKTSKSLLRACNYLSVNKLGLCYHTPSMVITVDFFISFSTALGGGKYSQTST